MRHVERDFASAASVDPSVSADPADFSATELLRLYRTRQLSPAEVARAVLERIERFEPAVNAFCLVDPERAMQAARESEARWQRAQPQGLLDGVPATIKDLILTRGWPTLRGSLTTPREQPWDEDAPATARLREQGAVLIGKTTTPEFGWKAVTDSALTGITRNPWNTARTPGGSSGGAAVACALGMGALHIGTDGGGSIRIPAAFTGIFGLKPSFGRVPAWPLSPFGTVAHIGPMTRCVADAALMLNVLARPDGRDWFALPYDARDYRIGLEDGIFGCRIAFSPRLGFAEVDPEIADLVASAVAAFEELGARVEPVDPGFADPSDIFLCHWRVGAANLLRNFTAEQRARMDPGLQAIAAEGEAISLSDYLEATRRRAELGARMRLFHERFDLLLTPTLPLAAFEAGAERPDPDRQPRWIHWAPFSNPFNLSQQPAASVPCGLTAAGLPVGLQIVGPMHADHLVLRAARAFESARPWPLPEAPRAPGRTTTANG
jgi:aspartyl-tRNA(Asn)/glutamyl-tRNA(Gln) amidotransferase subunit A